MPASSPATAVFALVLTVNGQSKIACDPDNGGIKLPQGFCALVVANDLGTARHLAVAPNGDIYVALRARGGRGRPETGGGVIGLRDANGDGKFEMKEQFGTGSTTGIGLRNGYLYLAHPKTIERFKMTAGSTEAGRRRRNRRHGPARRAAARRQGPDLRRPGLAVHQRRRAVATPVSSPIASPASKGVRIPARFSRSTAASGSSTRTSWGRRRKTGTKFATGLRQFPAITWHDGALYIAMNNRDQLDVVLAGQVHGARTTPSVRPSRSTAPSQGSNFGWPYCFFDYGRRSSLLNPEYGGDGKEVGRCATFTQPVAASRRTGRRST